MIVEFPEGSRSVFVHPQAHCVMNLSAVIAPVDSREPAASFTLPRNIIHTQPALLFPLQLRRAEAVKPATRER